ncbi:sel1 repeat family protein [Aestuariirhabdus litorea]|uniref:Sel1 repeat family protein n=1 Tax=Aestuariirhabdus litorea TaxID=2528527 RepID=A0A3P3VTI7_9GAMM|nr:sel1 repeat family protein [Aestuariirhabdus litorea]RRJ85278.1 sel1 repeat family protein [Aestuariirhabdus litorea]RWW98499.1 sel1 repeat family protein [Endozoicomonadaceae bacterium GTF-13]
MRKACRQLIAGVSVSLAVLVAPLAIAEENLALGYYLPMAEQGSPYAQLTIGELYMLGEEIPKDDIEAYAWLKTALAQGVEEAEPLLKELDKQLAGEALQEAQLRASQYIEAYSLP